RLDGTAEDAPEVLAHLAECAACARLHEASLRLADGLRRLSPPAPPPDFTDRLVAAVLHDQSADRRRRQLRAAVYALAACLLVGSAVAGLYYSGLVKFGATPQPEFVEKKQPDETPGPSVRDSVSEAGSAIASLTSRTADETVGQTRLLVPMV